MAENLAKLYSTVGWKAELVRSELGYYTEELSKQSVEGSAWFLLAAYRKMKEERDKLKKELLSKKEPLFDDLEDSQSIQIAKDAKIRKFTFEKVYPRERTNIEAGQTFDEEMRYVTNDLIIHLTETKDRDGVIQERSVETFLSNSVDFHDIHGKFTRFLRMQYQQKDCQFGLKGAES